MYQLLALLSAVQTNVPISPFWNNVDQVQKLFDPPPPSVLEKIQKNPWKGGLEPVPVEGIPVHDAEIIEGKIPEDLKGILCRNGPGRIRIGNSHYGHWFDGDGLVTRLAIDGEKQRATFSAKYVETERFQAQQRMDRKRGDVPFARAGAWTKNGMGKWWQNLFQLPTDPSNTNVMFLPGMNADDSPALFSISEGGTPIELDLMTLSTLGEHRLGRREGEKMKSFFSAHYSKDPLSGEIFNHGVILGANSKINLMKFDSFGNLIAQSATDLPCVCFIHDNVISENYFLVLLTPFLAPPEGIIKMLFAGPPIGKQFQWNPNHEQESYARIFSKKTLECISEVPLPLISTYHLIDAFEDRDNPAIVTLRTLIYDPAESRSRLETCFEDMYSGNDLPMCILMEYTLNVDSGALVRCRNICEDAAPCEFPEVNHKWGYRKRFVYINTRQEGVDYVNSLQKVDLESGEASEITSFGEGVYAGSPVFVEKADAKEEDDGYILTQLYRSMDHGSDIAILDARTMKKVTLLRLKSHVPFQFHGAYQPA